jgi:hypothetical protein
MSPINVRAPLEAGEACGLYLTGGMVPFQPGGSAGNKSFKIDQIHISCSCLQFLGCARVQNDSMRKVVFFIASAMCIMSIKNFIVFNIPDVNLLICNARQERGSLQTQKEM